MDEQDIQVNPEEQEDQEFDLDDIMKEFSGEPTAEEIETFEEEFPEEAPEPEPEEPKQDLTGDTIRLDRTQIMKGVVRNAQPIEEEEEPAAQEEFSENWEPEYEQPMGIYTPPQILIHPRSRLRELKRKLIAGPEKRYYELTEQGLGKLQAAIFLSFLVMLMCAGATGLYALGWIQPDRMKLLIFGQILAMLISALLGSYQLIEGVTDLFKKRFTLNTMLVVTFIVCCVDGVLCLQQMRIPCCAAFGLEMTMSLWNAYQRRNTEMGQMDTMRKATRLDKLSACSDFYDGKKGLIRSEGQVEDFMDTYAETPKPQKRLDMYALIAMAAAFGIGIYAGVRFGIVTGVQVAAVSLLAAVPATAFIAVSRPMAVLERRLHSIGTVLCGWQGVEGLKGKLIFPLGHEDICPVSSTKMNGVKFYGSREPDEIVAYCTALVSANGGSLAPLFTQVLDSRNGRHYDAKELKIYENGGMEGLVCGERVLVGSPDFLREMGIEVPELRVSQPVCVAIEGELCGLFAVSCEKVKTSAAGLFALYGDRRIRSALVTDDFLLTDSYIRGRYSLNLKRTVFPPMEQRNELEQKQADPDASALLLTTAEGLASVAYGVTGARALRTACNLGTVIHMIGGILGLGIMLTLTILGATEYIVPANLFLYQLLWMIPCLLITEWTRTL